MMPERTLSSDGRLVLRRPLLSDLDRHYEIYVSPQTNLYNPSAIGSRQDAAAMFAGWLQHWDQHGFGLWASASVASEERIIGFGGLSWRPIAGQMRLNLGYRFSPEGWGNGFATQLGLAALAFASSETSRVTSSIYAYVRPANLPSIRVLERLRFDRYGTFDDVDGEEPSLVFRRSVEPEPPRR